MKKIVLLIVITLLFLSGCSGKKNTDTTDLKENNLKEFTLEDLKNYNGQDGNPAYVAIDGVVYDVTDSKLWANGLHSNCSQSTYAGTDLSDLINQSPHGASIMKRMPVVGSLKE